MSSVTVALLVCSDRSARGERQDQTVAGLRASLEGAGHATGEVRVVADEVPLIRTALRELAAGHDVILTTGGTGIGSRDVTVEATLELIQKEVPGLGEAMRAKSLDSTPMAMLSRATAGVLDRCLVINLPGSPKGAVECLTVVLPVLAHARGLLQREVTDCQKEGAP